MNLKCTEVKWIWLNWYIRLLVLTIKTVSNKWSYWPEVEVIIPKTQTKSSSKLLIEVGLVKLKNRKNLLVPSKQFPIKKICGKYTLSYSKETEGVFPLITIFAAFRAISGGAATTAEAMNDATAAKQQLEEYNDIIKP